MFKRITFLKIIAWSYVKMLNSLPGSNNRASGFCFPFFQISHAPTDDFFYDKLMEDYHTTVWSCIFR